MLTLLLLACVKPGGPEAATASSKTSSQAVASSPGVAPVRAAATPGTPTAVPPPDAPAAPSLAGSTEAMVIEGLTRSTITFTIGADLSSLGLIDPSEGDVLSAHLAAHPRWRLTRWEGALVAMLRVDDQQLGRTVPWAGYHQGTDEQWRAMLRLSPRQDGAEWTDSPLVDRFAPQDDVLKVHGWQPRTEGHYSWRAAAIEVNGEVAALELHELSADLELVHTSEAIKWITVDLLSLDKFKDDTIETAPAWGWLPPGEPTQDAKALWVKAVDGRADGGVDVRGRLNPGAPGWTWVRITDADGRAWLEELTAAATLERVGWDADPHQAFWFQGRVPTELAVPASGAVEAWFQADGKQKAVQIGRWGLGG